jgi:hypothetical protein
MKYEKRIIKASLLAGLSELVLGVIFWVTGFAEWWYNHLHFFGYLGLGMILYASWHYYYYRKESKEDK